MILLDGAPKAFNPGVVCCSSFSIHRYFNALFFHEIAPRERSVLRSLVRIDDLRSSIKVNSFFHHLDAPCCFQRVADAPSKYFAAVNVHHRRQVQKTPAHRDVGNVGASDLIGARNLHSTKQIRLDVLGQSQLGKIPPRINGTVPHHTEQATYALGINVIVMIFQQVHHDPYALRRVGQQVLVHDAHYLQIFRTFLLGCVVKLATRHRQKLALLAYR